jgi:cytochrome c-type biogenesis protein CcmF
MRGSSELMLGDSVLQIPHSPIAALGTVTLILAFLVVAYAGAAGIVGHRSNRPGMVTSSLYAMWAFTALMTFASCLMIYAFITHDFRLKYVAHYSDATMPLSYLLTSYWGGLDGSLMYWVWVLSLFSGAALWANRWRHREMLGYVIATISAVAVFFLALLLYSKNPFSTFLTAPPIEGRGLNPLLQNYWMVIHPPSLYTGYVGMTIPFAFCMGALASGRLDDQWLHSVRVWVLIPWFFLSFGLILGGRWAYEELGWGGYWAWDPVENAALVPWFTATAFLHSVMIQERRGMLKVWNVVLVITTFWLTIFGTFMTRSGIVQSVHAFGEDNELALFFLLFLSASLIVSMGLTLYRLPALRSANVFESFISREVAFLLNNIVLLAMAFFVLFATMFPTLSQYVLHQRITVGPPFFNAWMVPLGLLLLALTGIGPLLAWRVTTRRKLFDMFLVPILSAVLVVVVLAVGLPATRLMTPVLSGKLRAPVVLIDFGLVAFVIVSLAQEFWRGAAVRRRQTGSDWLTSLIGITVSKRRKYGGYLVHVGIAILFFGFAGKAYQSEKSVTLSGTGQIFKLDGYTFTYDDLVLTHNDNRHMATATVSVTKGKDVLPKMYPARWTYTTGEQQTTTEVDIQSSMPRDIYMVLNGLDPKTKQANITVYLNPLVNFVWLGFGVLFLGFVVCILPQGLVDVLKPRRRGGGAGAGAAAVLVLAIGLAAAPRPARADTKPMQANTPHEVNEVNIVDEATAPPLAKRLWKDLTCMCGGCARESLLECKCGQARQERETILGMLAGMDTSTPQAQEKAYQTVVAAYVTRFGGNHVLQVPPDKGFNILAWALPYATFAGVLLLIFAAVRGWVHRGRVATAAAGTAGAAGLGSLGASAKPSPYDEKLDEELDELD